MIFFHICQHGDAQRILTALGVPKSSRKGIETTAAMPERAGFFLVVENASAMRIPSNVLMHAKSPGWTVVNVRETAAEFNAAGGGFRQL